MSKWSVGRVVGYAFGGIALGCVVGALVGSVIGNVALGIGLGIAFVSSGVGVLVSLAAFAPGQQRPNGTPTDGKKSPHA